MILAYQLSPPPPLQGSIPLKRSKIKLQILLNVFFKCSLRLYYELLGSEVLLYFNVAGAAMTAKVDSRTTARMGDHIRLAMDPEKIHVFDKETELTITN